MNQIQAVRRGSEHLFLPTELTMAPENIFQNSQLGLMLFPVAKKRDPCLLVQGHCASGATKTFMTEASQVRAVRSMSHLSG